MTAEMRIAVLGSTSFSGSDFIDLMLDDPQVRVLGISRSLEDEPVMLKHLRHRDGRYTFRQLHLVYDADAAIAALADFKPHYVVNFAALGEVPSSFRHPVSYFETNTVGLVRLATALKDMGGLTKFIQISTPEVYGTCLEPAHEGMPLNPSSPYAASKAAADLYLSVLYKTYGFPVIWVRTSNVYGVCQQLYRIIPRTIIRHKLGTRLRLDGGGVSVRSFLHIRDVSRGERLIMTNGRLGEVYHLAPEAGTSVRSIVETICRLLGREFVSLVEIGPGRLGQDAAYLLDPSKARREFGWTPTIDFDEGLQGVIDWIERHWDAIRQLPHEYQFRP
jgi:dTDP-glucose 4,6-dehydratase